MNSRLSTKQRLLNQLGSADSVLRDVLFILSKRQVPVNLEPLVELLLEKDQQIKLTLEEVGVQCELQKKIDMLRSDCSKSDMQIRACQLQLKKSEVLLNTALFYCRQKLSTMAKAVRNPVDVDEIVRFSHRISATHGVSAPDNWLQGDPRRPYPNQEEIRRGYLGHLDDNGQFRPSVGDALAETAATATNLACSSTSNSGTISAVVSVSSATHAALTSVSGSVSNSHGMDTSALSGSPSMILPGVNMVSSPLITTQNSTIHWSSACPMNSTEVTNTQPGLPRPSCTSLAAMLEPHSRSSLAPPPTRCGSSENSAATGTNSMSNKGNCCHHRAPVLGGQCFAATASPGSSSASQQTTQGDVTGSGLSFKASLTLQVRNKRRIEDLEAMTSGSSSESSSGED